MNTPEPPRTTAPIREPVFAALEHVLRSQPDTNPWTHDGPTPVFVADHKLLAQLLTIPVAEASVTETGRYAKAIDAWVAQELRRAGFLPEEVWPRLEEPRVLPREVAELLDGLPIKLREQVMPYVLRNKKVAPADARVLGSVYTKQADVVIAQWARGVELLVSTKSMSSSFGNNLRNRFEESFGDGRNLRGRFPLGAFGFLYLLRSTILVSSDRYAFACDMLRKLEDPTNGYDACGLVVAEWDDGNLAAGVTLRDDVVPTDLAPSRMLGKLVDAVLTRTPIDTHVTVRNRRERTHLPIGEGSLEM